MLTRRCTQRGVTGTEVVTILAALTILSATTVALAASLSGGQNRDLHPKSLRDQRNLAQIHTAFITFAHSDGGRYPRPGRIHRCAVAAGPGAREQHIPGVGPEDVSLNTTAALYAAMIAQEYFSPDLVISPVERNPKVDRIERYDYEAYDPANASYWDHTFNADLDNESNTSYAHLVMFGDRMDRNWRDITETIKPVLGNRGPKDGVRRPDSYTTGMHGNWSGNMVYNDNSVRMLESPAPDDLRYDADGETSPDNLFEMLDGSEGSDLIITFTQTMNPDDGPAIQFD